LRDFRLSARSCQFHRCKQYPAGIFPYLAGVLQQFEDDVFYILPNIARLRQGCRINNGERDGKHLGKCLSQKRFSCSGRADEQHIALLQFQIATLFGDFQALVVIVDCDSQLLLGRFLADDIQIKEFFYFLGLGEFFANGRGHNVVGDYFIADINTLVANVDGGTGNELFDVVLTLRAE
jgi:hypothetical protein